MAGNLLMQYVTPRVTMDDLAARREARQMRALQMEGVQRQNALGELTMQDTMAERERKQREANILQQLLQQSGGDEGRLIQGLQNSGIPGLWERGRAMADARVKAQQEADKAAAAAGKDKAEAEAKNLANRKAEIALRYQTLLQLPDQQSAAEAINAEESLTPEQRAQIIQSIPADPMQFKAWKLDMYFRATGEADKLLPKVETRDTGGAVQTMAIDPLTGAATVTNKADKTQSPDNKASNERQARDAAAARAVTMRGQDMADRRAQEANAMGGKPPPGYRWKPDGSQEPIPGGPADIKAGAEGEKREARKAAAAQQAESVLSAVRDAKGMIGYTTAGLGSMTSGIPGSSARDLSAKLQTVKANLGFDRLQQMREMSPTGGALGQVAVQELQALQATVSSLDQGQSPQQLAESLDKIERHYNNWLQTMEGKKPGGADGSWDEPKPNRPPLSSFGGGK